MIFILIHGAFGSPDANWFPELKADLEALGQTVIAPQFPVDNWEEMVKNGPSVPLRNQTLGSWLKTFDTVLRKVDPKEKVCLVGHSLGPLFILHAVSRFKRKLDCAIFVSPFLDALDRWEFNHANGSFYKTDFDFDQLKKLIPVSYVLYSDNDPYVSKQHSIRFAKALESSAISVRRAGHLNAEVNLNEFPLVRDLCYSRLDLSLYQRFLEHQKKQLAQDYVITGKDRGVIRLKPEDVIDEGIFHFRHLTDDGFCTLFTGLQSFWDPDSVYMQKAREAAGRVKSFVRVIVLSSASDGKSPVLRRQMKLDHSSGIILYACFYDDIKDTVSEPDFGIWDNDYVCIVRSDPVTHTVEEAELNSRTSDITKYQEWRRYILEKARIIRDVDTDMTTFLKKKKQ